MAFTAGSVEQAKAIKLAAQLSALYQTFGTGFSGASAALVVEDYAKKLGFGITGLTTGAAFPPFGSVLPSQQLGVAAALQNPRGETMANGIILGAVAGATVGIYMHKFVRTGEDYSATMFSGMTLSMPTTAAGTTFHIYGPFVAFNKDIIVVEGTQHTVSMNNGLGGSAASAAAGVTAQVTVSPSIGKVYSANSVASIQTVGVTRGTVGVAGSTFESFGRGTVVNGGFTACVFFGGAAGSTGTIS